MLRYMYTLALLISLSLMPALSAHAVMPAETQETNEVYFLPATNTLATSLNNTANQLGNAVAIYQYVHNNFTYAPYQGARSNSINTFLAQSGNDVDIASTLIAMLRSKNIPARYAVGTIQLPASQLTNWLELEIAMLPCKYC